MDKQRRRSGCRRTLTQQAAGRVLEVGRCAYNRKAANVLHLYHRLLGPAGQAAEIVVVAGVVGRPRPFPRRLSVRGCLVAFGLLCLLGWRRA